jgi:hypothetical protein
VLLSLTETLCSIGPFTWEQWVDIADGKHPGTPPRGKLMWDDKPAKEVLGMHYRSAEETTKDSLAEFKARGW